MFDEPTELQIVRKTKKQIRVEVEKRWKAWNEFIIHLVLYMTIMGALWLVWFQLNGRVIFWPLLLSALWGVAVFGHAVSYYQSYGRGATRRDQKLEREVDKIYQDIKQNGKS